MRRPRRRTPTAERTHESGLEQVVLADCGVEHRERELVDDEDAVAAALGRLVRHRVREAGDDVCAKRREEGK
jgi:hypothetical protein